MYDELVATMRRQCDEMSCGNCGTCVNRQAADAIEELQADKAALNGTVTNLLGQIKDLGKPRWIPVSERLPEEDEEVLVVAVNDFNKDDRWAAIDWLYCGEWQQHSIVTHWMPLPQPPKEEWA